jgi:hypothetical protein
MVKNSIRLKSQIGSQLWKIKCKGSVSDSVFWKLLERIYKFHPKKFIGYYVLKKPKPWINKGGTKLFDQKKLTTLQWIQHPCKMNGDNLNTEAHRHFRNEKTLLKD